MGTHQHEYTAGNLTMNSLKKLKNPTSSLYTQHLFNHTVSSIHLYVKSGTRAHSIPGFPATARAVARIRTPCR